MATHTPRAREPLTLARIDATALALVDEGGIAALSMRRLGTALGVDPMAIYHHVPNKQALFHRLVRAVFADMPVPDPTGPWADRVRGWALAYRDVVAAHPALVLTIVVDQEAVAIATSAATEELHRALAAAGLPPEDVELCADVVVDHVNGAVLACAPGPGGDPPDAALARHLADAYAAGLEVVLAGIATRIPGDRPAGRPRELTRGPRRRGRP
ncbi:TetR/AcrR family transcriptional regulator [Iamia sp. SCSIO 61187]|uniref:TetR/AcrR family transcriptional regulator n=1 Tax=Iamia sp. SCSIO 61187 TaxID=2722752 RepID=UPI001C635AE7|nr:TetR/AcrR family transcriptional regulator [Iamia sp. SCSIO 61187]